MFGRKKKPTEPLPWYRARGYKGNFTENEKRQLDSFRMKEKHPAATFDSLPDEVQSYISVLRVELDDAKQESLIAGCFVVSGAGAFFLARYAFGYAEGSLWDYIWALSLLIAPWIYFHIQWKKNADQFDCPTDETLQREWEMSYIVNQRSLERDAERERQRAERAGKGYGDG